MEAYPQAYVIPLGQGQRSNPEANRLVGWLLRNGIEVAQLKKSYTAGSQTFAAGSYVVFMNQALRGLAHTALSIGVDVSPRINTLYAPPGAWSHGFLWGADVVPIPDGVTFNPHPVTKPVAGPAALGGGVEAGAATSYALKIDSATAVRALNTLTRDGVRRSSHSGRSPRRPAARPGRQRPLRGRRGHDVGAASGWPGERVALPPCDRRAPRRPTRSRGRRGSPCSREPSTRTSGRLGTSVSLPTRCRRPPAERSTTRPGRIRSTTTTWSSTPATGRPPPTWRRSGTADCVLQRRWRLHRRRGCRGAFLNGSGSASRLHRRHGHPGRGSAKAASSTGRTQAVPTAWWSARSRTRTR